MRNLQPRRRTLGAPQERSFGRSFFGWGGGGQHHEPEQQHGISALLRNSMTLVAPALGAQIPTPSQLPQVTVIDYSQNQHVSGPGMGFFGHLRSGSGVGSAAQGQECVPSVATNAGLQVGSPHGQQYGQQPGGMIPISQGMIPIPQQQPSAYEHQQPTPYGHQQPQPIPLPTPPPMIQSHLSRAPSISSSHSHVSSHLQPYPMPSPIPSPSHSFLTVPPSPASIPSYADAPLPPEIDVLRLVLDDTVSTHSHTSTNILPSPAPLPHAHLGFSSSAPDLLEQNLQYQQPKSFESLITDYAHDPLTPPPLLTNNGGTMFSEPDDTSFLQAYADLIPSAPTGD
ncbi:hypothetical protein HK097_002504, partial [Rhizophlyctis rosea]